MRLPPRSAFFFLLLLLTSCNVSPPVQTLPPALILVTSNPHASPTPTPFQPAASSALPVNAPPLTFTSTPPSPTNTPPLSPTLENTATPVPSPVLTPQQTRTRYTLYALLDYDRRQLAVDETVVYTNRSGLALNEIIMAVEPMHRGGFTMEHILLDGAALDFDLNGHRMTVYLPQPLPPNAQITLAMRFSIVLPPRVKDHPYGYDTNQINLTDWFPFIVPYRDGWVLHDDYALGEHLVYDAADFEVNFRVTQGNITVAASGVPEPNGEWTQYHLSAARTFALSASDQLQVLEATAGGAQIRSYYYAGYEEQGLAILNAAVRAVDLYSIKFAPYPYESLSIVQADLNDGQEYDGLVFLATKFYNEYNGSARSNLVTIGVHEIAHQWWFGLVGSDQALEPWLDEALCVYSEAIFYRYIYPNSLNWWWQFRVNYFGPSGYVDISVYEAPTFRAYVNATYLNGANFLEALNDRMGDDAFYAFLQEYAARYEHGHATAYEFFALAKQHSPADFSDLIAAYFRGNY